MSSGGYYNGPAVEWARRNLAAPVKIRSLLSSRRRRIYVYALVFCLPGAFFLFGLVLLALGVKAKDGAGVWALVNSLPAQVRDDGVPRETQTAERQAAEWQAAGEEFMRLFNSPPEQPRN